MLLKLIFGDPLNLLAAREPSAENPFKAYEIIVKVQETKIHITLERKGEC